MRTLAQILLMSSLLAGVFGKAAVKPDDREAAIPSRTLLKVTLIDALHSDTNSVGDNFLAKLAEPIVINGTTALEEGTILEGLVLDSVRSDRAGRASMRFGLTGITRGNRTVPITTNIFSVTSAPSGKRGIQILVGAAGLEAGIGALNGENGGTGFAFAAKEKGIHYAPETRLNFTLTKSVAP